MNGHIPNQIYKAYSWPVVQLLSCGDPSGNQNWPDYLAMGFEPAHIPELIRITTDEALNNADSESSEVWAPLHAWRTLGQLRAEAAIDPLIGLFERIDKQEDDWVLEDLPQALGEIGPSALAALSTYLANPSHGLGSRQAAAQSVNKIGQRYPESRDKCVAALNYQLAQFKQNGKTLNGMLISCLLDLDAVESALIMAQAFAAKKVDQSVVGDWADVQLALGLSRG
jgi:Protein of unknown function (DUF1186)